jgi:glutathione S-transferase
MITIYHAPNSRSQRIVWLMEEMQEPYRLESFGIPVPESFLAVNPLGSVPTIVDDDADTPITMFESIAILLYITGRRLVAGNERAIALAVGPRPDAAHYAHHLQFLHFGEADLATPIGTVFRTRVFSGEQSNATIVDQLGQIDKRLAYLDSVLADGRAFVTGDRFTIADISIGYAFLLAEFTRCEVTLPAHVAAYWARLQARPGYKRSIAV